MKRTIKVMSIVLMAIISFVFLTTNVMAAAGIIENVQDGITYQDEGGIGSLGGQIANVLSIIGIVVAIITLLVLGIKYMMGSASEKAEYKKTMIPYLIGAVLVFGASAIVSAVVNTLAS